MKKDIRLNTYWTAEQAEQLLQETQRTHMPTSALIRFHTLRSIQNPQLEDLVGAANRNIRQREGVENR